MLLSLQEWIVIGVTFAAILLIVSGRLRADLVAIIVLAALPLTGVVTYQEALSGFSRSVVITIIGLFIISEALEDTGIVQRIADYLRNIGAGSEFRLLLLFMSVGAGLSLLMNNVAAGAILLPAAVQVGREANVSPSKLLIPVSFGTLVGGMATYFTTANIVMSSILRDQGQPGLSMLDFIPSGGLIVLAALIYMALIGRRFLPNRESSVQNVSANLLSHTLSTTYQLQEHLWEVVVPTSSPLINTPLCESQFGSELGLTVMAIWRGHQAIFSPAPTEIIQANDFLLIMGAEENVEHLRKFNVEIGRSDGKLNNGESYVVDLTEIIIPPRSAAVGHTLVELQFRNRYQLTGVALWRRGQSYRTDVGKMPLDVGDALLMIGSPQKIKELGRDSSFLLLRSSHAARPPIPQKAGWALAITALILLASIINLIPTSEAMMVGVAALALTGCINLDEVYRSIEWRVIFLVAGMLPISLAMIHTGLAERVGQAIVATTLPFGPLALIAALFLLTVTLTQVIGGQVAALIVGPIAVTTALKVGIDAKAVGVAVAIACSAAFLTPIAHLVNVLMMNPGGYIARDFFKVGLGMTLVTFVTLLIGMRLFWGV